ncbi:MAG: hypothetical protein R2851_13380 [Caldilineaceae bacterium]
MYVRTSLAHGGVGLLVALPLLLLLAAPVRAQTPPFFEETDCAVVADLAAWRDDDLRCGYVVVPERRQDVTDPAAVNTIRLAVVVLPATGAAPADDPLFVAQGGPGGSTIDVFTDLLLDSPLRDRRDIVLFDQRGTLYSDPNLICTEFRRQGRTLHGVGRGVPGAAGPGDQRLPRPSDRCGHRRRRLQQPGERRRRGRHPPRAGL